MSWQQIKALREQRAEHRNAMQAIVSKAEAERRDLTADEASQFDALATKAELAGMHIDRHEQVRSIKPDGRNAVAAAAANWSAGIGSADAREVEDASETRALLPGESCRSFLQTRSHLAQRSDPGIGLGAFLRSALVGPKTDLERRALSEASLGAGGYTVNPHLSAEWIDSLKPASVVMQAGCRLVPLFSDRHHIARVATSPSASWIAELQDVPESTAAFDRIELVAKDIVCHVRVSRQLLMDSLNIESLLGAELAAAVGLEIDRVGMFGSGASNQPLGIANTTGVGVVSMGTNGAALTDYDKLLDAQYELAAANAGDVGAAVMNPRSALAIAKFKDANSQPLARPESLKDVRLLKTTAVPINDTQGTAVNASKVIVGDWSRLIVGVRLEPRLEITPGPMLDNKLQTGFVVWGRIDIAVEQPKAFAVVKGIIPAA